MFGRLLKIGSIVVVTSIFMTGCLLSSSIQQHVADNYQQMSANVEAQIVKTNADPVGELARVNGMIAQERQSADRYQMLLIGVVIAVLVASTLISFTITWYLLNRHLQPVADKYDEVSAKGRMIRNPGINPPFANLNVSAMNVQPPEQPRVQPARPPMRHYKVNAP